MLCSLAHMVAGCTGSIWVELRGGCPSSACTTFKDGQATRPFDVFAHIVFGTLLSLARGDVAFVGEPRGDGWLAGMPASRAVAAGEPARHSVGGSALGGGC